MKLECLFVQNARWWMGQSHLRTDACRWVTFHSSMGFSLKFEICIFHLSYVPSIMDCNIFLLIGKMTNRYLPVDEQADIISWTEKDHFVKLFYGWTVIGTVMNVQKVKWLYNQKRHCSVGISDSEWTGTYLLINWHIPICDWWCQSENSHDHG